MKATIVEIVKETGEISSFRLRPEEEMEYTPGQWMDIRLTPDVRHHFTISSSPTEAWLQFTTKFRGESEFKKMLWEKKVGETMDIKGPFGSFILDEKDIRPRILVGGGIGITPFRSMLRYMADKKLDLPTTLIVSVKNRDEGAFIEEMEHIDETNTQIKVAVVETDLEGRLNEKKIKELCPDWSGSTIWLCGPPAMVEALVEMAKKIGFSDGNIQSEEFTGY